MCCQAGQSWYTYLCDVALVAKLVIMFELYNLTVSLCAGADIVGVNCHLDPLTCVETVKLMKEGLENAGLKAHLMIQPLGFHTPERNHTGYLSLPEFPFGEYFVFFCGMKKKRTSALLQSPSHICPLKFA